MRRKSIMRYSTLFLLAVTALGMIFLALEFDLVRGRGSLGEGKREVELDDALLLGGILTVSLLGFAWRRNRDHRGEMQRRIAAEALAHASARFDVLTGLPNRRMFLERAGEALSRAWAQDSHCAVFFIDLDGFKPVNDTFGHAAGDALLVEIAARLRRCIPDEANVARLGGDEFVALIEFEQRGTDVPSLAAKRLLRAIQQPHLVDGEPVSVGATIGVAVGPQNGRRADDLIKAADAAMYEAKRAGRGRVKVYQAA